MSNRPQMKGGRNERIFFRSIVCRRNEGGDVDWTCRESYSDYDGSFDSNFESMIAKMEEEADDY